MESYLYVEQPIQEQLQKGLELINDHAVRPTPLCL